MKLVCVGVPWVKHHPFWFKHGGSGDPHEFFETLDGREKAILLRAIKDYAAGEHINRDRGHEEGWDTPSLGGELVLFKYKVKGEVSRFYAVVHDQDSGRRSVIVHGFRGHQSKRKEKDDPRARAEKASAEERVVQYFEWLECQGAVQ